MLAIVSLLIAFTIRSAICAGPENYVDEIYTQNRMWKKHFEDNQIQKLVDRIFEEDCKILPPNQPIFVGRSGVFKVLSDLRSIYENVRLQSMELKRSNEYAYEISRYNFSNSETFVIEKYISVWHFTNEEFRKIVDSFNNDN